MQASGALYRMGRTHLRGVFCTGNWGNNVDGINILADTYLDFRLSSLLYFIIH